jgi:acetyl-CoA carboxylase biotin carboxylase subunit
MIAKVIGMGTTREHAISRMSRALSEYLITGIKTTIPFQEAIMRDPDFVRGKYNTGFVGNIITSRVAEFRERPANDE